MIPALIILVWVAWTMFATVQWYRVSKALGTYQAKFGMPSDINSEELDAEYEAVVKSYKQGPTWDGQKWV